MMVGQHKIAHMFCFVKSGEAKSPTRGRERREEDPVPMVRDRDIGDWKLVIGVKS